MLEVRSCRPSPGPSVARWPWPGPRRAGSSASRRRRSLLVLVVAALLRLPFPDLTPFGHDEALEAERARPIWYGARPVDSEITSWLIPDPAGLLYFYALAEPFPQPAVARVLLVALANVVSVVLCYLLARRFFGPRVGLVAGLLYAANPWAVTFGRQPWVITQPLLTDADAVLGDDGRRAARPTLDHPVLRGRRGPDPDPPAGRPVRAAGAADAASCSRAAGWSRRSSRPIVAARRHRRAVRAAPLGHARRHRRGAGARQPGHHPAPRPDRRDAHRPG